MRSVLRELSEGVQKRLVVTPHHDARARILAIVEGNFDPNQVNNKVTKTWLAFWSHAMHEPTLFRLQRVNEQRLLSHLRIELKKLLPKEKAAFVAQGVAALIDGIWLRGALNPRGIDPASAVATVEITSLFSFLIHHPYQKAKIKWILNSYTFMDGMLKPLQVKFLRR